MRGTRRVRTAAPHQDDERYRAVVQRSADAISLWDGTVLVYANPAFAELLGLPDAAAAIGLSGEDFAVAEDWPGLRQRLLARQAGAEPPDRYESRVRRRDGTVLDVEASAAVVTVDGRRSSLLILRDVTGRRRVDEASLRLTAIVETSVDAIFSTAGDDWSIDSWNRGAERLYGYPAAEIIGQSVRLLVPPERAAEVADSFLRLTAGQHVERTETVGLAKGGRRIDVSLSISPVRDAGGSIVGCATIARDVGDVRRAREATDETNRQLAEALAELQEAHQRMVQQERLRAMGEMASGIAHDFNNQLGLVLGHAELLLKFPQDWGDREAVEESLTTIYTAAQDAAAAVRGLRIFYQASDEALDAMTSIDLPKLLEQVVTLTQARWHDQALSSGARIKTIVEQSAIPPVLGLAAELREALTNLIFNAVDAMPQGGELALRARFDGQHVVLTVGDTGVGMAEDVRRRCFEPFFSTKGELGTGLGLSMVYGIVRHHGGTIDVVSAPGRGTTFTIRLRPAASAAAPSDQAAVLPTRSVRVLLAEDEPGLRRLAARALREAGHVVEAASNGREALDLFRAHPFDLVLTDHAMPEMSGDQLAVAVKSISASTPVVLLTGFADLMEWGRQNPPGVDLILSKPITAPDLSAAIAQIGKRGDGRGAD
jgi:PAS domain S-box-containing protein